MTLDEFIRHFDLEAELVRAAGGNGDAPHAKQFRGWRPTDDTTPVRGLDWTLTKARSE